MVALADQIGFPMMVKPSRGGSALGCSKVSSPAELPAAIIVSVILFVVCGVYVAIGVRSFIAARRTRAAA